MEEAGELCAAARDNEGRERVASEAADLLYHALVLLNTQVLIVLLGWWSFANCGVPMSITYRNDCQLQQT